LKEIQISIKVLTPAFIGGWDNVNTSEFRVSSLKGLLRYWWRAFYSQNYNNYNQLLQEENEIFGGQGLRSRISIRIIDKNERISNLQNLLNSPITHNLTGIRYLFFSMFPMGRSPGRNQFINPGSSYKLSVSSTDERYLKEFLKALWALENFGGIGARSRRGAGSIYVENIEYINFNVGENEIPNFLYEERNNRGFNLQNFINRNLNFAEKAENLPEFTKISNNYFYYKIIDGNYGNWEDILNYIGEKLKDFRSYLRPPFNNEARAIKNYLANRRYEGPNLITKPAFGLPIIYRFRNVGSIEVRPKNSEYPRRASPLFIKVGIKPDGNYYGIVSVIWSRFLPDNEMIALGNVNLNQPNIKTLKNFLNFL
jgi:CRISPR-associated protein Cmr1